MRVFKCVCMCFSVYLSTSLVIIRLSVCVSCKRLCMCVYCERIYVFFSSFLFPFSNHVSRADQTPSVVDHSTRGRYNQYTVCTLILVAVRNGKWHPFHPIHHACAHAHVFLCLYTFFVLCGHSCARNCYVLKGECVLICISIFEKERAGFIRSFVSIASCFCAFMCTCACTATLSNPCFIGSIPASVYACCKTLLRDVRVQSFSPVVFVLFIWLCDSPSRCLISRAGLLQLVPLVYDPLSEFMP